LNRNLAIGLNIIFSLCWVYLASQFMTAKHQILYMQIMSFVIIAVFMLTLLAVLVKHQKLLKWMLFANRLFAIFMGVKFGMQYMASPSDSGLLFIVFVVLPFVINSILLKKIILDKNMDE
jgi:hypothetical protein